MGAACGYPGAPSHLLERKAGFPVAARWAFDLPERPCRDGNQETGFVGVSPTDPVLPGGSRQARRRGNPGEPGCVKPGLISSSARLPFQHPEPTRYIATFSELAFAIPSTHRHECLIGSVYISSTTNRVPASSAFPDPESSALPGQTHRLALTPPQVYARSRPGLSLGSEPAILVPFGSEPAPHPI